MGKLRKAPTVNKRIRDLKKQKAVTGGKATALPPGVMVKRKKAKAKRGGKSIEQQRRKNALSSTI